MSLPEKPGYSLRYSNPRPLWNEACALPLCHNHCPTILTRWVAVDKFTFTVILKRLGCDPFCSFVPLASFGDYILLPFDLRPIFQSRKSVKSFLENKQSLNRVHSSIVQRWSTNRNLGWSSKRIYEEEESLAPATSSPRVCSSIVQQA